MQQFNKGNNATTTNDEEDTADATIQCMEFQLVVVVVVVLLEEENIELSEIE